MIIENGNMLLQETQYNLAVYVINNKNLSSVNTFNISDNIQGLIDSYFIDDNIIIILKKISDVPPSSFYDVIKKLGGKTNVIRKDENYILIINKEQSVYFELVSSEPIYYPYMIINKVDCRMNPRDILPPKKYLLYKSNYYDDAERCGHETNLTHFALDINRCTPLTDLEYQSIQEMPRTGECADGLGQNVSMATYGVSKIYTFKNMNNNNVVTFYEGASGTGKETYFKVGIYDENSFNRMPVGSLYVPPDYYLFVLTDKDILPYYGPLLINVDIFKTKYYNRVLGLIVQKYVLGNVVVCGSFNNNQICMTFGKGVTILYPKLFIKISFIKMDEDIETVSLFADISATDLIETFTNGDSVNTYVPVMYPRVVRSISVK
jgi:hypothetical protein